MKKRAMREMSDTLAVMGNQLDGIRRDLVPLKEIHDDLVVLARTQKARTQFVAEVAAVQRERSPDSVELQIAKQIADNARHVLRALEWSGKDAATGNPCCPICQTPQRSDHRRDCALYQVIGPPRLADAERDSAIWATTDAEAPFMEHTEI